MSEEKMVRVKLRYTGPGGEVFGDWHWQPKPGDELEVEIPDHQVASLDDHPTLELAGKPARRAPRKRGPRKPKPKKAAPAAAANPEEGSQA